MDWITTTVGQAAFPWSDLSAVGLFFLLVALVAVFLYGLISLLSQLPVWRGEFATGIAKIWNHPRRGVRWISRFALFLAPIWLVFFAVTLTGLGWLWLNVPDAALATTGPDRIAQLAGRLHFLAIVGLTGVTIALVSAPLALMRVHTVERQTKATEEGLVTDRINVAVQGLGAEKEVKRYEGRHRYVRDEWGSERLDPDGNPVPALDAEGDFIVDQTSIVETVPNIEVRIGAILALERIAKLNLSEHIQIMETLCAYIRQNTPASELPPLQGGAERPRLRADLQMAMSVLGRRTQRQRRVEAQQRFRLDIMDCNLRGARLFESNFSAAKFSGSLLDGAQFNGATLIGTDFSRCKLDFTTWRNSIVSGVRMDGATMRQVDSWDSVYMAATNFTILAPGADLSAIPSVDPYIRNIYGTRDTKFSDIHGFDFDRLAVLKTRLFVAQSKSQSENVEEIERELESISLQHWSPFEHTDLANHRIEQAFMIEHDLYGWPYRPEITPTDPT